MRTGLRPLSRIAPALVIAAGVAGCAALAPAPRRGGPVASRPFDGGNPPRAIDEAEASEALVALHNQIRKEKKLPSLGVSRKLTAAAREHAADMARRRKMTHEGSDGSTPMSRALGQGYRVRRVGENVAYGQRTPEAVMEVWMGSRGHRANILGTFSDIGAGCATAEDGTPYWCVTFGLPARRK